MTTTTTLDKHKLIADLRHFTGTEMYHTHAIIGGQSMNITDGCHYLRENAGCYWLFDIILIQQATELMQLEPFQRWQLKRLEDGTWLVTATDGNTITLYKQRIQFSDFPLEEIIIYVEEGVALLRSEH
jgi:hypothetical protein